MRTTRPLRAALPADLIARIEAEARRRDIPVEQLVEQAVLAGLARLWALVLERLAEGVEASQNKRLVSRAEPTVGKGVRSAVTSDENDAGP